MEPWLIALIIIVAWVALLSVVAIFMTHKDKNAAKGGKWRTPEATLLLVAALGGAVAMLVTMRLIRHKTKHKKFMLGIPLIILFHIALLVGVGLLYWHFWH